MIYTVGDKEVYDKYIKSDPQAAKAKGGSVWRTRAEVKTYLIKSQMFSYEAYGVKADWHLDTKPDGKNTYHQLNKAAKLVKLR